MCSYQSKIIDRRQQRARGREYLASNPPVDECVIAFLESDIHFSYAFLPSDETDDKLPEYMIKNEERMKEEIYKAFFLGPLKFDKVVLLLEIYESYHVLDEYLEKFSKTEGPNLKNVLWYKFLKDNFTYDFRMS